MVKFMNKSLLKRNIYHILDQVLQTGVPVEIEHHGKRLKIILAEPVNKLNNLIERQYLNVEPEEIIHLDWSDEWSNLS